jgi:hypothetical protein
MGYLYLHSFACISFATFVSGCTPNCDDLQDEASALKDELGRCTAGDACVTVNVEDDCLGGALGCGFAVPAAQAERARSQAQAIADESLDCNPCSQASCPGLGEPTCDAASGRCVFPAP